MQPQEVELPSSAASAASSVSLDRTLVVATTTTATPPPPPPSYPYIRERFPLALDEVRAPARNHVVDDDNDDSPLAVPPHHLEGLPVAVLVPLLVDMDHPFYYDAMAVPVVPPPPPPPRPLNRRKVLSVVAVVVVGIVTGVTVELLLARSSPRTP